MRKRPGRNWSLLKWLLNLLPTWRTSETCLAWRTCSLQFEQQQLVQNTSRRASQSWTRVPTYLAWRRRNMKTSGTLGVATCLTYGSQSRQRVSCLQREKRSPSRSPVSSLTLRRVFYFLFGFHLSHSERSRYIMQFVVEAASIADWLAILVSPPQCGRRCFAIGARRALSPR